MERIDEQASANSRKSGAPTPERPRRVPAYFTLYLLSELLSTLRSRSKT
ncbi:MAG: hypothetical protein AAGA68_19005 [Pseudomonadota bacterium]